MAARRVGDKGTRYSAITRAGNAMPDLRAGSEPPDALPGRGENGVAHGRGDHRQSGLADTGRLFLAHDYVDFRFRSLDHERHFVVVEVRLLDAPVLDGDGVVQSGGKAIDGGAFHLRTY